MYNPGDMCVVWRPPKDAELGSKLSWQNTVGPYRVLASQNARAARLAKRSGSPSVATVTEKQKQGVLLLIRATQALYDTVGAHGYQRREGKIATFPF